MKRTNANYFIVGAVVLAVLILLGLVLQRVTGQSLGGDNYYAFYREVGGIKSGTPIYFEGYRVGQVEEVTPEHQGSQTRFKVDMSIQTDWPIPRDSVANIASAGLLSDVFVSIASGESQQILQPGSEMQGRESADLFGALNGLAGDVSRLMDDEIRPLIGLLTTRLDSISGPLSESLPQLTAEINSLMRSLNASSHALEEVLGPDNRASLRGSLENVERTSESLSGLAADLRESQRELHGALARFNTMVEQNAPGVDQVVTQLKQTVNQLSARLDLIAFNLEESSRNFNEFTRSIRREPNRLIFSPEADKVENE